MAGNNSSRLDSSRVLVAYIVAMFLLAVMGCTEVHLFVVSGQVVDRSGQPRSGLKVSLEAKGATIETQTDGSGHFLLQCDFTGPEYDVGRTKATIRVIVDEDNEYVLDVTPTMEPPRGADDRVRVLVVTCESDAENA